MGTRCQQSEVYQAEKLGVARGREIATTAEAERFLRSVLDHPSWPLEHPRVTAVRVEIQPDRPTDSGVGTFDEAVGYGRIEMGRTCELYLLHELSHVLIAADHRANGAHGPYFCRQYLELVWRHLGSGAYQSLLDRFEEVGVRHDPEVADDPGEFSTYLPRRMGAAS
jgi:hypothetical protein